MATIGAALLGGFAMLGVVMALGMTGGALGGEFHIDFGGAIFFLIVGAVGGLISRLSYLRGRRDAACSCCAGQAAEPPLIGPNWRYDQY